MFSLKSSIIWVVTFFLNYEKVRKLPKSLKFQKITFFTRLCDELLRIIFYHECKDYKIMSDNSGEKIIEIGAVVQSQQDILCSTRATKFYRRDSMNKIVLIYLFNDA